MYPGVRTQANYSFQNQMTAGQSSEKRLLVRKFRGILTMHLMWHGKECAFLYFSEDKIRKVHYYRDSISCRPPPTPSPSTEDILFSILPGTEISEQVEPVCMDRLGDLGSEGSCLNGPSPY